MKEFLQSVWGAHKYSGYAFLAYRGDDGRWHEVCLEPSEWETGAFEIPNGGKNLYFCPNLFTGPKRNRGDVLPSKWLYADLDEVNPQPITPLPTTAWETSEKRYQALWRVNKSLAPKPHRLLNKKLTYFIGADKSGWNPTRVLRVPGSTSTKYDEPAEVKLLWADREYHSVKDIIDRVHHVKVDMVDENPPPEAVSDMTASAVLKKYKLPKRARELIRAKKAVVGERSDRLWELECLLIKAGVPPEEALVVVRDTVWNKYRKQRRELRQLWTELNKAKNHVETQSPTKKRERKKKVTFEDAMLDAHDFLNRDIPMPSWMVEGIWSNEAHGMFAGEAKTYKTLLALDLAVSVGTGTPFLNYFPVPKQGPVIFIEEEGQEGLLQDRLEKIARSRKLRTDISMNGKVLRIERWDEPELPVSFVTNWGFDLTDEKHIQALERAVRKKKAKLVVLDPFYLMTPGVNENSAEAVTPILRDLLHLKQELGVGFLLIHHFSKQNQQNPRQGAERMSGTSVFHRWLESGVYIERTDDPFTVKLTSEHRSAPSSGVVTVEFNLGDWGNAEYLPMVEVSRDERHAELKQLEDLVETSTGVPLIKLAQVMDKDKRTVQKWCKAKGYRLEDDGPVGSKGGRPQMMVYPK